MQNDRIEIEYGTVGIDPNAVTNGLTGVLRFFGLTGDAGTSGVPAVDLGSKFLMTLYHIWEVYSVVALLFSAVLIYGIIYARLRVGQLLSDEKAAVHAAEVAYREQYGDHKVHDRFESIMEHASSDNPNDWRLAIIEADIVLEELLDQRGFPGTTIGERLKSASPQTFKALDDAWKAHKVRNEIAHRGGDFILTKRLVNETIAHYQRAFTELSNGSQGGGGGHGHH